MRKKISAVTIEKHYLEKKLWCVKKLYALVKPNGNKFWFVRDTMLISFDKGLCRRKAGEIARNYDIPFIEGLRHGANIKFVDLQILKAHGIEVK